jgi:hypothetical protein
LTETASISAANASLGLTGNWTNAGSIIATDSMLQFGALEADSWSNSGSIALTGSTIDLAGSVTVADFGAFTSDLPVMLGGELINTGFTLDIDNFGGAGMLFDADARIAGGTVTGASNIVVDAFDTLTLDDVILGANVVVNTGGSLNVATSLTLNDVAIALTPASDSFTNLRIQSDVLIDGTGSVDFAGTSTQVVNRILVTDSNLLTIGENVKVQTTSGNGEISGEFAAGFQLDGALINTRAGGVVDITVNAPVINGSITIGAQSKVTATQAMVLSPTAALDMDIDPAANALFESTATLTIDGALNVALQGAVVPGNCQAYTLMTYPSFSGGFATFDGPDIDGIPFTVDAQSTQTVVVAPGVGC